MNIAPRLFTEETAKSDLGFIEAKCRRCVERAESVWNSLCDFQPRLRKASRGRGRNAIFNELVADFAREEFDGEADVELCEQYGTVRLHVKQKYDCGFKKVDRLGRSANYPTVRRKRYDQQLPLFGEPMPEAIRVHIGYQWNEGATEIVDVYVVEPAKKTPLVFYPLAKVADDAVAASIPMPVAAPQKARMRSKLVGNGKESGGAKVASK